MRRNSRQIRFGKLDLLRSVKLRCRMLPASRFDFRGELPFELILTLTNC